LGSGQPEELSALMEHIANHRWTQSRLEWEALGRVYRAYQRNAAELLLVITDPQRDPDLALKIMSDDQAERVRDGYYDELFRHLLNYVTAVRTLFEHSRNHLKCYAHTDFAFQYASKTAHLSQEDVSDFLNRLRNYLLHCRFPPLQVNLHWSEHHNLSDFAVTLDRDSLLMWDGWTKGAKAYIRRKDPLVIRESVEEYDAAIVGVYEWLFEQFRVVHAKDLDDLHHLQSQVKWIMSQGKR
jgi:hypothetical protein